MAERASTREVDGEKSSPPDFDFKRVPGIVEEIENAQSEIDEIMDKAKKKCAPIRERIAEIKKTVGKQGCPREELNTKLRERKLLRAAEECRETLSADQRDNYDRMSQELGDFKDTALGGAAMSKSKH